MDLIEINEAFSSAMLGCVNLMNNFKDTGLIPERVQ